MIARMCKNILILNQRTCTLNFKEWALWSKCFGKVVMINGLSCSGKTTLTKNLRKIYKITSKIQNEKITIFKPNCSIDYPYSG